MAFDVEGFTDALMLGTKMLIAKSVDPLRAENAALRAANEALAARLAAVEAMDVIGELGPQIVSLAAAVAALPGAPDLSGFATKAEIEAVREAIPTLPEPVDLTGLATKGEIEDLRSAIPGPIDLSGLATKAEVEEVRQAIPTPPESVDLSGHPTKAEVAEAIAAIPAPAEPQDLSGFATKIDVAAALAAIVIPEAINGKDADPEAVAAIVLEKIAPSLEAVDTALAEAAERITAKLAEVKDGKDGVLPIAEEWADKVHHRGAVVTHRGALWQATGDTGKEPPHADWQCLAAAGRDGLTPEFVGTYEESGEFRRLDVVALNGGSFVALRDNPGLCPGDGWQLLAGRGKPGPSVKGEPGDKGNPGRDADEIVGFYRSGDQFVITTGDGRELKA